MQSNNSTRRIALLLSLILLGAASLQAQSLVCRAGTNAAVSEAIGRIEPWPMLSHEVFIGPEARSALLTDGSVVLVDLSQNKLMRIDRASGRVTVLARNGEGPGEIKSVLALVAEPGDTIALIDVGNLRTMRWTRSGRLASSKPYKVLPIPFFHWQFASELIEIARSLGTRGTVEATEISLRVLRADSTVTLRTFKLSDPPNEVGIFTQTGIAAPLDASRVMLATGASPEITLAPLRGGQERILRLAIGAPTATTKAMATRLVTLASSQIPEASRAAFVSRMLQMVPINPTFPLFSRLVAGTGGSIWVQRTFSGLDAGPREPPVTFSLRDLSGFRWEQFSPTGTRLADCLMPQDWRVLGVGPGWVLFAQDDDDNTRLFTWRPR